MTADPRDVKEARDNSYSIKDEFTRRRVLGTLGATIVAGSIGGTTTYVMSSAKDGTILSVQQEEMCTEAARKVVQRYDLEEFNNALGSSEGDENYDPRFNIHRDGNQEIGEEDKEIFETLLSGGSLSDDQMASVSRYLEETQGNTACTVETY